ncbi:hypothetical protein D3C72_377080 [compost metagenome]
MIYRNTITILTIFFLVSCGQTVDTDRAVKAVNALSFSDGVANCETKYSRNISPSHSELNEFLKRRDGVSVVRPIRMVCYMRSTSVRDIEYWAKNNDPIANYALALLRYENVNSSCEEFNEIDGALLRSIKTIENIDGRDVVRVPEALYSRAVLHQNCARGDWRSILEDAQGAGLEYQLMINRYGS